MIYQGIDRSILEIDKDGDIKVYFSTEDKGIKLQDITSMSHAEVMWVHDLYHCGVYAIDLWRIDTTPAIRERELIVGQLHRDIENCQEVTRNIEALFNFTLSGNPCDYRILSKSQKYLAQLEASIKERTDYIENFVYSTVGRENRHIAYL